MGGLIRGDTKTLKYVSALESIAQWENGSRANAIKNRREHSFEIKLPCSNRILHTNSEYKTAFLRGRSRKFGFWRNGRVFQLLFFKFKHVVFTSSFRTPSECSRAVMFFFFTIDIILLDLINVVIGAN